MVDQRVDLQGRIALKELARLQGLLLDNSGDIRVSLHFGKDEEGVRYLSGTLDTQVVMQCQRCLQPVTQTIESQFKLGIVFSEEAAKNLPSYYDPLLLDESDLALWQTVEEELLLSLPIAAMHPDSECRIAADYESVDRLAKERNSPFQVLAGLKDDK